MWSLREHRWHRRVVSSAVVLFQLATVMWIPVVHPLLHPDTPPPAETNQLADHSEHQENGASAETSCFICAAGHQFSASVDQRLPLGDGVSWRVPLNTLQCCASPDADTPANAPRAPPSIL